MSELRLYTFVNFYLSSIQQGIQTAHVVHEMFNKYPYDEDVPEIELPTEHRLYEWSNNHKTLVVLNGGANIDIEEKYALLQKLEAYLDFPMPFTKFSEDEQSLGGVMTACGCVLPEEIYDAVAYNHPSSKFAMPVHNDETAFYFIKDGIIQNVYKEGTPEHELITMVKSCPLAR